MSVDYKKFFKATDPSRTLRADNEEDQKYYIDFSTVRGGQVVEDLKDNISLFSDGQPTCQLFTGHIGCGKSTEILQLKQKLEAENFHVVYFESSQDMEMGDVDLSDILLAIARQVSESLQKISLQLEPKGFKALLKGAAQILQTPIELSGEAGIAGLGTISVSTENAEIGFSLPGGIGKITAKAKDSPAERSRLRQYLEPRTNNILDAINSELLDPATKFLKEQGKQGLVVIVDNLDRVDSSPKPTGRTQPEYLFVDRGDQLRKLNCHMVYTIPLSLIFSNDFGRLTSRFGLKPKVLTMVPVQHRNGEDCDEGMNLLRQMVLARAFPDIEPEKRLELISELFDEPETLDRLCRVSGGHVRNLLGLLYSCLQQEDPPFERNLLEDVIKEYRDDLLAAICDQEWQLMFQALENKTVRGDDDYQILLRSMFLFEYRDREGRWYWVNPPLAESSQFKAWLTSSSQPAASSETLA